MQLGALRTIFVGAVSSAGSRTVESVGWEESQPAHHQPERETALGLLRGPFGSIGEVLAELLSWTAERPSRSSCRPERS
jgi:hypothetical protein